MAKSSHSERGPGGCYIVSFLLTKVFVTETSKIERQFNAMLSSIAPKYTTTYVAINLYDIVLISCTGVLVVVNVPAFYPSLHLTTHLAKFYFID